MGFPRDPGKKSTNSCLSKWRRLSSQIFKKYSSSHNHGRGNPSPGRWVWSPFAEPFSISMIVGKKVANCNQFQHISTETRRLHPHVYFVTRVGVTQLLHVQTGHPGLISNNLSYCWWKTFCTIWDVWSPVNNGLNYQSPNKKLSYKLPSLKLTYPLKMGLSKKESIPPSTIFQGLTIPTQDFIIFTFSTTPTVFTAGTLQTGKPGNNVVAVSGVMEFTIPEAIRAGGKWDESQPYSRETNGQ